MTNILDTQIKLIKNVGRYNIGSGAIQELSSHVAFRRSKASTDTRIIAFIDYFFETNPIPNLDVKFFDEDIIYYFDSTHEPTTDLVDSYMVRLKELNCVNPCAVIGIGGGATLDMAKAVSNLLANGGKAADYQGWDLLKKPGIFKIGIPTLSGTGAEATRTCVMTNAQSGLKLGMNSDFTVFDQLIMDPQLTSTVPRNQYFYTGMDAYVHCIESLNGAYRNAIGDAYSHQTIKLCRQVFHSDDMMSKENRENLMVASYLGGCAIGSSYVGVIHPLSAGLSVVLGVHHCVANCITMRAMEEFYPKEYAEFWEMAEKQNITIPEGVCATLNEQDFESLYEASIIHEKPLYNALGPNFKDTLTLEKVTELFKKM